MVSLGLVSPGAVTDGVTIFFSSKTDRHFFVFLVIVLWKEVMTFLAVVSSPLPSAEIVYVLS